MKPRIVAAVEIAHVDDLRDFLDTVLGTVENHYDRLILHFRVPPEIPWCPIKYHELTLQN
jgi:hypothetical protein